MDLFENCIYNYCNAINVVLICEPTSTVFDVISNPTNISAVQLIIVFFTFHEP